jgi:hypothetical protein
MEPEGSLPYSQAPATCPYTELAEANLLHIMNIMYQFQT